jgi:hypothetical protein
VVVGEHHEDPLADEERWLPMRELFGGAGQGEAEFADAVDLGRRFRLDFGLDFGLDGLGHLPLIASWLFSE